MATDTQPSQPSATERLHRAVSSTRGLVIAEALVALMVGFTADDLELLRFPGYILGLSAAFLLLSAGGLLHGWHLNRRLEGEDEDTVDDRLRAVRSRGRLAAVLAAIAFVGWLVLFSQGVPPWSL